MSDHPIVVTSFETLGVHLGYMQKTLDEVNSRSQRAATHEDLAAIHRTIEGLATKAELRALEERLTQRDWKIAFFGFVKFCAGIAVIVAALGIMREGSTPLGRRADSRSQAMKLIDNWTQFYRFASVHGMLLMTAWGMTPQADQQALMQWLFGTAMAQPYVMPLLAFLTLYLRLVKQASVTGEAL